MYTWLNDLFPLSRLRSLEVKVTSGSRSSQGQGHPRSRSFGLIQMLSTRSRSIQVIIRSRSSKRQGHPKEDTSVCYSDVCRRLLNRTLLFDGLDAATTVVGLNNVYCTQWVNQWPFPTEKIIWRSRSFEVKVMTKEKVIWSHTVMSTGVSWTELSYFWWSWCDNRCYSRDPVTLPSVKVILRSRSFWGQGHPRLRSSQGQGHLVSRSRSFGLIQMLCTGVSWTEVSSLKVSWTQVSSLKILMRQPLLKGLTMHVWLNHWLGDLQWSFGLIQCSLRESLGQSSPPWWSCYGNLLNRAEQCMFHSIIFKFKATSRSRSLQGQGQPKAGGRFSLLQWCLHVSLEQSLGCERLRVQSPGMVT